MVTIRSVFFYFACRFSSGVMLTGHSVHSYSVLIVSKTCVLSVYPGFAPTATTQIFLQFGNASQSINKLHTIVHLQAPVGMHETASPGTSPTAVPFARCISKTYWKISDLAEDRVMPLVNSTPGASRDSNRASTETSALLFGKKWQTPAHRSCRSRMSNLAAFTGVDRFARR